MGRHIHFKDGKFNLWSTVIDSYELSEWVDEETVIQAFMEIEAERAKEIAKEAVKIAKEYGCSVRLPTFRCSREDL